MHQTRLSKHVLAAAALGILLGSSALTSVLAAAASGEAAIADAVGFNGRPQGDVNRDKNLHPNQVLAFAGIKPGMEVADIMPGTGYWSRLLSHIVGDKGDVYMYVLQTRDIKPGKDYNENDTLSRAQIAYSVKQQPEFKNFTVLWDSIGSFPKQFNVPKQLDAVVTADYGLWKAENPKADMAVANASIFRALKNGGIYLLVMGDGEAEKPTLDVDAAKSEITAAGFTFVGQSGNANDAATTLVLKFEKPKNAPNTDMRPKNIQTALAGYFGNTRRTNPGLIRKGGKGERERRVMFHPDMTYEEWGQIGTGNNPWQSGYYYFGADGAGCMIHMFPTDQQGFINCEDALAPPGQKPGDMWFDGGTIREFVGPGYYLYPDANASQGGTLGNTPEEKARKFGQLYGFAESHGASHDYLSQYLDAYHDMSKDSGGDAKALDAEFAKSYGKPVPDAAGGKQANSGEDPMSAGARRDQAIAAGQRPPGGDGGTYTAPAKP